jgi:hypothetical protein
LRRLGIHGIRAWPSGDASLDVAAGYLVRDPVHRLIGDITVRQFRGVATACTHRLIHATDPAAFEQQLTYSQVCDASTNAGPSSNVIESATPSLRMAKNPMKATRQIAVRT